MARVRRRMYRRRKRNRRRLCIAAVLILLGVTMLAVWVRRVPMLTERRVQPSPTPVTSSWDRTVVTRDVTLQAETWYTIQTGVFSALEAAQEKADAYTDRGAPGTVIEDGGKWRVFIASYGRETDASAVRTRLGEVQRVETYLYHWNCPEICLRLTGMAGQLDVAEAGLTLMTQSASLLRDTAIMLDAGQVTTAEAVRTIEELDSQVTLWADTAKARFGKQPPQLVKLLLDMTDGWVKRCRALKSAADSATTLSAELKGQGMEMYDEMISLRVALSEQ